MPATQNLTQSQLVTMQRALRAYGATIDLLEGHLVDDEERANVAAMAKVVAPLVTVAGMGGTVAITASTA